ncbi:unnamed protein product, partial [Laminaria digitata]
LCTDPSRRACPPLLGTNLHQSLRHIDQREGERARGGRVGGSSRCKDCRATAGQRIKDHISGSASNHEVGASISGSGTTAGSSSTGSSGHGLCIVRPLYRACNRRRNKIAVGLARQRARRGLHAASRRPDYDELIGKRQL